MPIFVEIAVGELIDKITILEIKLDQINETAKRVNIRREYEILSGVLQEQITPGEQLSELTAALKAANQELWHIEDDIRDHERAKDFGPEFIALARSVYQTNDRRAVLKREINALLQSAIIEEKSYAAY
ncbi:MAG: DUF6165 family protein [Methylovirgula sp.]